MSTPTNTPKQKIITKIEDILCTGIVDGEEVDVTTGKIYDELFKPLLFFIDTLKEESAQLMWGNLEKSNLDDEPFDFTMDDHKKATLETVEEAAERYSEFRAINVTGMNDFFIKSSFKGGSDWQRTSILALIDGEIEKWNNTHEYPPTVIKIQATLQNIKKLIENGK